MNNFCVDLDISIPLFKQEVYALIFKQKPHSRVHLDFLNPDIISIFESKKLEITLCEAFYRKPTDIIIDSIHKDAMFVTDATKINWVFNGHDSLMNWYEPITSEFHISNSKIGAEYIYYDRSNLKLLHSQRVGFPSLVQVGSPHDITMGLSDRLCISILFKYRESNEYVPFSNSIELFNEYITGTPGRIRTSGSFVRSEVL